MIILFLRDGLGNQMFQYAFVRNLQIKNKTSLKINVNNFKSDMWGRKCSLQYLNIPDNLFVKDTTGKVLKKIFDLRYKFLKGKSKFDKSTEKHRIIIKDDFIYVLSAYYEDEYKISPHKMVFIEGCFQMEKLFKENKETIVKELKIKQAPTLQNKQMLEKIKSTNSVCVHIRRGDYLHNTWSSALNICDYNYFKKGMEYIKEKVENAVFYVFSNNSEDIKWIKENYDFGEYNVEYVDLNNPDYEELRLMYSCKHFIISNSSFSWWAQYLGEEENKIVVAPSVWNRQLDAKGIYMDNWEIVEV